MLPNPGIASTEAVFATKMGTDTTFAFTLAPNVPFPAPEVAFPVTPVTFPAIPLAFDTIPITFPAIPVALVAIPVALLAIRVEIRDGELSLAWTCILTCRC